MRVFARRERPHPGAQLSLFEAADGWRYSLWVTNLPAATRGWRGQCAYIDAAHRVHARVEDVIRTGKDTGLGHFPSHDYGLNKAWLDAAMIACILLSWLKLLALDGDLAEQSRRRCAIASALKVLPTATTAVCAMAIVSRLTECPPRPSLFMAFPSLVIPCSGPRWQSLRKI